MIQHRWWHRWLQEMACSGLLDWYLCLSKGLMENLIHSSKSEGESDEYTSMPYRNFQSMERFWHLIRKTTKTHIEKFGKFVKILDLTACIWQLWVRELRKSLFLHKSNQLKTVQIKCKGINLWHRTVSHCRWWEYPNRNIEMTALTMILFQHLVLVWHSGWRMLQTSQKYAFLQPQRPMNRFSRVK